MDFLIGFHAGEEKRKNLLNLSHGLELTPLIVVDIEAVFVSKLRLLILYTQWAKT